MVWLGGLGLGQPVVVGPSRDTRGLRRLRIHHLKILAKCLTGLIAKVILQAAYGSSCPAAGAA